MGTSSYSYGFKRDAAQPSTVLGYPVREVSGRLGASAQSPNTWVTLFGESGRAADVPGRNRLSGRQQAPPPLLRS
jgi:transposase-like protein